MDYEVVIPVAPKDYNKVPYVVESILDYLSPLPKRICVIHAGDFNVKLPYYVVSYHEQEVLPLDPTLAKNFNRPQWIYQQFLKLFQDITKTDPYLVVDSDLIVNRPLSIVDESDKPLFLLGVDQNHTPYFRYSETMFGFGKEYDHSFISEIMLFNKKFTYDLLLRFCGRSRIKYTFPINKQQMIEWLYGATCREACNDFIPADYEIYGNYMTRFFPGLYDFKNIKTNLKGKYSPWTNTELESYINEMKDKDYDTITAHTWI